MREIECDVAVIGAGTAGLMAMRRARQAGARTLLVDPDFAGTTCATVGCMPSKLLIAAADAARAARRAGIFGVEASPSVDGRKVMRRVRAERDRFVSGVRERIAEIPADSRIRDRARFFGPGRLALEGGDTVKAGATVVATGASPRLPEPFAGLGGLALTNESLFELADLPGSVAVVGAGPLGLELAQALAGLGVKAALFDRGRSLGGLTLDAVQEPLRRQLEEEMDIYLGVEIGAETENGRVRLSWSGESALFDRVLVAAGRPPALSGLDLEKAGLDLDDRGMPLFDPDSLQCGDAPVFIAGDADADRPVLHEAAAEGAIAGVNAASFPKVTAGRRKVPFAIVFSRPEIALVGRRDGDALASGACSWADQGRARSEARNRGEGRLFADSDGRLVGAELCAPDGEHLGHLLAWAVQSGLDVGEILDMPFYHPTLAEGLRPALRELCRSCGVERGWDSEDDERPGH